MTRPVCTVIGFGPGVGAAVARRFAAGGFDVVGLARSPEKYAALVGPGITLRAADAMDAPALTAAIPAETRVIVYNAYRASLVTPGPSALSTTELAADFAVNVTGALVAAQAVLPAMRRAGAGSILFTGGGLAFDPTGWLAAASLAVGKAGLRSLAASLHAELAPAGIHVGLVTIAGVVAPGTPFDPDRIAEAYWDLHGDPVGAFRPEIIFRG